MQYPCPPPVVPKVENTALFYPSLIYPILPWPLIPIDHDYFAIQMSIPLTLHAVLLPSDAVCVPRGGVLVDHPPSLQAEVRGGEGQGGRRPHPGQCVLREIPGRFWSVVH